MEKFEVRGGGRRGEITGGSNGQSPNGRGGGGLVKLMLDQDMAAVCTERGTFGAPTWPLQPMMTPEYDLGE